MHRRIEERRRTLAAAMGLNGGDAGHCIWRSLRELLETLETSLRQMGARVADARIDQLVSAVQSSRSVIALADESGDRRDDVLPCVMAALEHVHGGLVTVARDIGGRGYSAAI